MFRVFLQPAPFSEEVNCMKKKSHTGSMTALPSVPAEAPSRKVMREGTQAIVRPANQAQSRQESHSQQKAREWPTRTFKIRSDSPFLMQLASDMREFRPQVTQIGSFRPWQDARSPRV